MQPLKGTELAHSSIARECVHLCACVCVCVHGCAHARVCSIFDFIVFLELSHSITPGHLSPWTSKVNSNWVIGHLGLNRQAGGSPGVQNKAASLLPKIVSYYNHQLRIRLNHGNFSLWLSGLNVKSRLLYWAMQLFCSDSIDMGTFQNKAGQSFKGHC